MSAWLDNLMSDLRPQKRERAPFAGAPLSGDDWLEQLLMTAQPMDVVYPTIDTRGKAPIAPPDDSFHPIDALAAGVGMAEEHFGEITGLKNFADEGRAMRERNMHQYEDNSVPYHLQNILLSAPESLGIMAASTAAGSALGGPLGAAGGFARGLLSQSPKIASAMWNLAKAYQGGSTAAKIARTVVPASPQVAASVGIGAGLEARVEQNEAEKRYIENAKRNGTYVEGQTEREAREIGNDVFWDNMGIISLFNAPQYNMIFGKPAKNLLGTLGRFGLAAGSEGAEEVAQEIASAHELGEPVEGRNVRDAFVAGAGMGGIFHGVGRGVPYAIDRITGQPTQEQIENERKAQFKSYSDEIANRYANAREIPDLQFDPRNLTRISETPAENPAPEKISAPEKNSTPVEDVTTKNLLEQFAEEKLVSSEDPTEVEFFDRMFTDKGKFRNTPENRAAILKNFGDEFSAWRNQIETPAETQSSDEFLSNPKLFDDARNLLANLREENSGAALELQAAIQAGDAATIEKFLRQYKTTPVENSTPAENPAPAENAVPITQETPLQNILALPAPQETPQQQEEYAAWKAKQDREVQILEARKAEAKRLAQERRREEEQRIAQQEQRIAQLKRDDIQTALGFSPDDTQARAQIQFAMSAPSNDVNDRKKQGSAILNLLELPQFRYSNANTKNIDALRPSLKVGAVKAIRAAQDLLNELEVAPQTQRTEREKIRELKSQSEIEAEQRRRAQKKIQGQWQREQRRERFAEQDAFADELQFEDELLEGKLNRAETLEDLFGQPQQEQSPQISAPAETSTQEAQTYSSPLANAVQKFWNFPSTKLETPEAQKIYSLFTDWDAQGETSKPREFADELNRLTTEDESAPLPQLIEQARSKIETAKPVQPQVKRTNPAEMAAKVLATIPTDSFITEDEILDRIDDLEPSDLSDIMLKLELNGSVQERAGSFKRTNPEQQPTEISWETPKSQSQIQQEQSPAENRGKTAEVITGNRTPHQIQYRVMEADALNSSHTIDNGNVFANKNYPAELQPRDRTRSGMQAQLIGMSENLNPADLLDARDVNQGAPTVRNDGVVLNGNGRVAAIRRAYEIGKGETYKSALVENAERFGLNADAISRMTRPVLVREITGDLSDEQIRDITGTQTGGAKMGASEQAQSDAKKLSSATLSTFPQNDNVDLSNAEAVDFLRSAIADIATPDERNALTTSNGKVSQDGINRVKRALFALAYGNDDLIARMSESTDDNIRGVTNALLNAAPTVAKLQSAMKNGTAHNYDLSPIVEAVKKLSSLRDEGKTVANFLQEQSLFAEHKFSDEAREILTFLDRNKRAPNKTAALLKNIAQKIRVHDPREANLFGGETQIEPLLDIIKRAAADVENRGMENLFDRQETTSQPSPPTRAIFRRNDENSPDIPAGRKAIKEAPAGTKIRTLSGQNTETNFVVGEKNIQMLDENEQPIGQTYTRNSENMRKIFGSSGVQEIELTYPQEANQNVTVQTTQTEENPRAEENSNQNAQPRQTAPQEVTPKKSQGNKKASALHAKLKTDTHPHLKAWLDDKIKKAAMPGYKLTRGFLEDIAKTDFSDYALDNVEENLRQSDEAFAKAKDRIINRPDLSEQRKQEFLAREESDHEFYSQWLHYTGPATDLIVRDKNSSTVIFRRGGFLANIPTGRRAVSEAPAGTKVRVKRDSLFSRSSKEKFYIIGDETIQEVDENGQPTGQIYNSNNLDEIFGRSSGRETQEIELTYPQEANQNITTQSSQAEDWQLGKYEDDSEPAPKPKAETQKPEEDLSYEERLDREAETYFVKHRNTYMDDTPYFGAAIKASAFPDIGGTNSFIKSIEKSLDEIVESYGGRPASRIRDSIKNYGFETAEKRDKFVRAVMQEGLLDTERDHRISLIREREKKIKADAARQAEKDKILTDAKNEAYKILEADKYPETKSWVDRQIQNVIRKKNIETVAEYEEFAKDVIESVRSYKAKHNPARNAALEALYQWRDSRPTDSRGRISRADSQKYDKAEDIIRQADSGELSPDEAYAEMKHFLRTGRRTKSKPQTKSDESIGKMNAALREASEKIINDAAKNPDVARALEQLGATVKNGKVSYPDDKTFQACVNLVNSGIVKYSQSGKVDTTIKNFVDPQDLNSFQRAFATFAKEMGVPIVFFRGDKNFHGAHANGISFYNADANFSHEWVYWHEFGHWLKNNQPELFGKLSDAANVTDEQIAAKRKSRTELSDEDLREEIICDAMSDVARRAGIFQQFAKKNQSLIQRLMSWAKSTLDRFTDWFHTRERGLTTAQRAKMYDAFGKIARQIEDADGNKIFRYNNRTHEVELIDGRKLETVDTSTKPKYSTETETKNTATEGELELPEGYRTESGRNLQDAKSDEFIIKPNGSRDFGEIGKEIVTAANEILEANQSKFRFKIAPVRLQVGTEDVGEKEGFGYKHIMAHLQSIRDREFDNIPRYVEHVLKNFNQVYKATNEKNRIILYCKGDKSKGFMPIDLEIEKHEDDFYTVITAYPRRRANKHETLLVDARPTNASTVADTVPHLKDSNNELGVASQRDIVVSNVSNKTISQPKDADKPKYSLEASDEESIFRRAWNKFSKALHLNGDKIVTEENKRREKLLEQEKAMADYLKEPTKENRQKLSKLGVTKAQLDAYQNGEEYATEIGLIQNYRSSPSRIAEKVATFRAFFRMGDRAMDKLVKLRDSFNRKYDEAMNFVKDKSEREQLVQLLWDGDEEQREFGKLTDDELSKIKADNPNDTTKAIQRAKVEKICDEAGVSENVAKAYLAIRRQLERAYTLLDEARRRPQNKAAYLTAKQYERLRDNKFVKQGTLKIHDKQDADGKNLVTWTEYANTERKIIVDGSAAARFLNDDAIQILGERELADGTFELQIREGIAPLNKLTGYVPHFFHEFTAVVRDADGKQVGNIIGTGKNQREAIKLAEDWQKNHQLKDGEQIFVLPHTFNFGMDENFTPIMGDKDFAVMMSRISRNTGLPLDEAKQIVNGAVKLKSRHRFLGQLLHRKGYAGYEKDMDWVLRHHFNTAARYVALETEFKPKAISLFERVFGAFDKDHSKNLLAQYTKNYINDVNGVPAWIDEAINKTLNQNSVWRKYFLPNVGERGGQRIANSISARIAYLKLGMGNISSALINFTQLINAAGYVGWQPLMKHFGKLLARRGKLTQSELRILNGSGVLQDIGLDTASGYDKNRGSFTGLPVLKQLDWVGQKSMWLFTKCDAICRASTALAAYENSVAEGKTRSQALDYAKKINRAANFSYGVEDAPNIFRRTSSVGKIGLQFYKYPLKQLEVIADFLPQNKKTTFKQKASFWIPYFFVCGLMGFFPFFDWGDKLLNEKFKLFPKDFLQKLVIQGTQEIFGKDSETGKLVGKVIMYGAPALANVDISGRTGLASIMPQETSNLLFGATGSTIYGVGSNLAQGNSLRALQSLSPGLYNIVAAIQGETRDARNRKISAYEEMHDRIVRGLGFKSVDESLAVDVQRINFNERDENKKRDQRAIDAYIEDPSPENLKRLKELGISGKRVKEERGKKNLTRLERLERNMTKAERKRNEYLLDFAR